MAFGPERKVMTREQVQRAEIDVGLRRYMLGVYNYMALGVAFTGALAMVVAMQPALLQAVLVGPLKWVLFGGIIAAGFFGPQLIMTRSAALAHVVFWVYAGMWGTLLGPWFYYYTGESIVRVFFITAAAFAGLSIYGYTTKRDLSRLGAFLCMATFGILIALLVNIFLLQSSGFHLLLSIVVVLVFAGLTAFETQMIRNFYYEGDSGEVQTRKSIFGAFLLYGSFVTMFIWLLQLFGVARE